MSVRHILLGMLVMASAGCSPQGMAEAAKFKKFATIYEPSGLQQLADGRFIVVQDESSHPFDLFVLSADGDVEEQSLFRAGLLSWASPNRALANLEDLEGVTSDAAGYIYAITSHSRKENGKRDDVREQLVRFRLEGEQVVDVQILRGLRKRISAQYPALTKAVKLRDVKGEGGFNIEGLSFDAHGSRLLIGLRGPQTKSDEAIIVVLNNPQQLFVTDTDAVFAERLITLDLKGGGIRGLSYDDHLGGYLILSARPGKSFKLWFWQGHAGSEPRKIKIDGLKDLRQAEGVAPVRRDGKPLGVLIVSDEGDGMKGKPGRYSMIRYDQMTIE